MAEWGGVPETMEGYLDTEKPRWRADVFRETRTGVLPGNPHSGSGK